MNRRHFLQAAAAAAVADETMAKAVTAPRLIPLPAHALDGLTLMASFTAGGTAWAVWEDLRSRDGSMIFVSGRNALVLGRRTEAMFATATPPHFGLALRDIALADADLLAGRLLAGGGDPDPHRVRDAAPPTASDFDETKVGARLPWTVFVGTRHAEDTMPVFRNGRTRTFRPEHDFPELRGDKVAINRYEGLLGGWLPVVDKVIPRAAGGYHDLLVFGDVDATDRFVVQTWHRTAIIEGGRCTRVEYGHSYTPFPPRREPPAAADFYRALLRCATQWYADLADLVPATLPEADWSDMVAHAFAKELMTRPGGVYPKYGAVDRDYYGSEYDGFQDSFTSSLYANLEWGRFAQAAAVLDQYLTDFTQDDGMINMRGPETAQFGLTLSLLARYLRYTGDLALLLKHRDKIAATATILTELHDASLKLAPGDPGFGLIAGWSESDACLHPDPRLWWKPYWSNSAFAVRGWRDIAAVWPALQPGGEAAATTWRTRADTLQQRLVAAMRHNIRHDLTPAYLGPLPGVRDTFRQALARDVPSEQGWPHRVYAELLHADVLPDDLANLVVDCLRGHGGTTIGVVANIGPPNGESRDILGFISYGYAQQLLRLDRIEEYLLFLYAHRYHAHTRGSWVAGEVSGITGDLALFCIPAQLTIPLLVRWMLVFEESDADRLHLGRALPVDWTSSGKPVAIVGAPTRWGPVDFRLVTDVADKRVDAEVVLHGPNRPREVHLRLRLKREDRIVNVTVNGHRASLTGPRRDTIVVDGRTAHRFVVVALLA